MILLVSLLVAGAVAALTVALSIVFGKRQARVERRLAGYELPDVANTPMRPGDVLEPETRVVQQAVAWTGGLAARAGVLARTELALEQADLALRPAEFLFYVPVFGVIAFLVGALLGGLVTGAVAGVVVLLAPPAYLSYRRRGRIRRFALALPDTLTLLAGSMRAGFSFLQGLEAVADETSGPMQRELQRVFTESRLGRSVEDALDDVAERMQSNDLGWAVMAIRIQREVGGNLAELLDTVAETMTERERLRRDIRSLTAEGRLSGIVLSIVPIAFAGLLFVMEPDYIGQLFDETIGVVAVIVGRGAQRHRLAVDSQGRRDRGLRRC